MSELGRAIEALRAAVVAAATDGDEGVGSALETPFFASADVVSVPGERTIDHVSVVPAGAVHVADLETILGPARRLPRAPAIGSPRTVLFERTVPDEGSAGATVLAETRDDDVVSRLIVRADRL